MSDGKIEIHAPLKPLNDNERMFIVEQKYVKGADQIFSNLAELVAFHPDRMQQGMTARVANYPTIGDITEYYLNEDPAAMIDGSLDSIVTIDNFGTYWSILTQQNSGAVTIREYAPSKTGGARPSYPYAPSTEVPDGWTAIYDPQLGHKWMRFRTDDVDVNTDGVFDNWSIPVQIGTQFAANDYIENRFIRQDADLTIISSEGGLQLNDFYIVVSGNVDVNGVNKTKGTIFEHVGGNTYTFNTATVQETVPPPPSTDGLGAPNNEPTGYSDTIPVGSAMLWVIEGQKTAYGQLKSDWVIRRINEDPNYIRYSNAATPDPNTIVDINTSAAAATQGDTDLTNAGWANVFSGENFIATRQDDNGGSPGPPFLPWKLEKINEESGEFVDSVFKLFDFNLPVGDPLLVAPTEADPTLEGWFDTIQPETGQQKNFISSARKFIDGTLKTAWSDPAPFTGFDIYVLNVESDSDDDFKTDKDGNVVPATIQLDAELFKGVVRLWEDIDVPLTFSWKRVYDNGSAIDEAADFDTGDDFYLLADTGTPGQDGYKYSGQRLIVKPDGVTGKAIFRAQVIVTMADAPDITITKDLSLLDVSDGLDAKDISIGVDNPTTIYDTVNTVHVPAAVNLTSFYSNIGSPTLYWYVETAPSTWTAIVTAGAYTVNGNILNIDTSVLFAADGTAEEFRFAVSTHATDPDLANGDTIHTDYKTVVKLGSAGVGAPGVDSVISLLDNEAATIVLDKVSIQPVPNETGAAGRVITKVQVYDGATKKVYGGGNDYTIVVSPTAGDIQFGVQADGADARVFIAAWTSSVARSATCTITITYGALTLEKVFQIGSTLDAPGAIVLDVDSNKGFAFTPQDVTDKTLTASLYDTNEDPELQTSGYEYNFQIAGIFQGWTAVRTQLLTRNDILTSGDVVVQVRPTAGSVIRTRTLKFYDIVDSRIITMLTASDPVVIADKIPTNHVDNSNITVNSVDWKDVNSVFWDTNPPIYACYGEQDPADPAAFIWSNPFRIKGEKGDQGVNGNFFFNMYKQAGTALPNGDTSTLGQMTGAGWTANPPGTDNVYVAQRLWTGEGVTFDVNNLPSTGPVGGTTWLGPIVFSGISGNDGANGSNGADGDKGWSQVIAIVSDGSRRVQQLSDWVGGEGTKPGNVGNYIGPSGYVTSIGSAVDVRGATGATGAQGAGFDSLGAPYPVGSAQIAMGSGSANFNNLILWQKTGAITSFAAGPTDNDDQWGSFFLAHNLGNTNYYCTFSSWNPKTGSATATAKKVQEDAIYAVMYDRQNSSFRVVFREMFSLSQENPQHLFVTLWKIP